MKRFKTILFLFLLFSHEVIAQTGHVWQCHTVESENSLNEINFDQMSLQTPSDISLKIINIFVHVLRRTDGTGGLSNVEVSDWIELLCQDYSDHNISIRQIGLADINNTSYYNGITNSTYSTLINTNTHANAIDIYLLSPNDTYSRASSIPGIALTVGGNYVGTSVLSHEFGHCLGLYHTHSGRGCNDNANCSENIDGSNCSTCGDLVCDTPADPCLAGNVDANCLYTGDSSFSPDVNNIMSYSSPNCLNRISTGQTARIHSIISTNAIFTNRTFSPTISGPSLVCTSNTTFTLQNRPAGTNVTWTRSRNLTQVSGQGTDSYVVAANSSDTRGDGWVRATLTGPCGDVVLPQKPFWVGLPHKEHTSEMYVQTFKGVNPILHI